MTHFYVLEKILQDHLFAKEKEGKISIIWNHQVDEVIGDNTGVTSVRLQINAQMLSTQNVDVHWLCLLQLVTKPNTAVFLKVN